MHGGVLFLDELAEFAPTALDALRQPLEEGIVRISRARFSTSMPARILLVAAMNPCPCGLGGEPGRCRCTEASLLRYRRRLSGPLLDRFDLRIDVDRPAPAELLGSTRGEDSATVRSRVLAARAVAGERGVVANALLRGRALERWAPLEPAAADLLGRVLEGGGLSARGLDRIRRVARTIADLDGHHGPLAAGHVAAALALRAEVQAGAGAVA